ncbi:peroxisomal membrane protein pex14 [Teratosphaeriaceae sp. CCFEE 6253]|nr:peroxisomal membrane protein pex14 [Teratosphaeriaceae sp. CCFEE 6253]
MVREDLIDGAISFLQDPSVASAPVEQKIAFLRSKNLTQDEIDASLARVGQPQGPQAQSGPPTYSPQQQQQPYRPQQPQQYQSYNNGYQQQQPYWPQQPPEPPRRDWRDYFIMATLLGGVSYGLYWTARRYITPLIAPPTPPQLEQDKAHIDSSFDRAFTLLDQLATDTQSLKDAETSRTERLDTALAEVESVLGKLKEANEDRTREARGMAREMNEVREQIPKALEREKKGVEGKLEELAGEMRSLKTLVGSRLQQPPAQANTPSHLQRPGGAQPAAAAAPAAWSGGTPAPTAPAPAAETNGTSTAPTSSNAPTTQTPADGSAASTDRSPSVGPYGRRVGGGKAQIPSWQLAAKKRSEEKTNSATDSGTVTPAQQEVKPAEVADEVVAEA